jgi:hypothetical protein
VSWGGSEPGSQPAREGGGRAKGSTRPARGGEREPARVHSARLRARDESEGRKSRNERLREAANLPYMDLPTAGKSALAS